MEKFTAIKTLIASAEKDAAAFYDKGNYAAGTRLRNALQKLKVAATELRQDVLEKRGKK